jgi:hypothetical protein
MAMLLGLSQSVTNALPAELRTMYVVPVVLNFICRPGASSRHLRRHQRSDQRW